MNRRLLAILFLGILVRAPFWAEALRTPLDGDEAIVGLMALHPGRGATLWSTAYGSPVESWLVAPFVALLGPGVPAFRLPYFLLGLALIPTAYALGAALHPRAAVPAALVMACPAPYFLLLAALPPVLYPASVLLSGLVLVVALRADRRLEDGARPLGELVLWGVLAGLALWTHLTAAATVAVSAGFLFWRGRRQPRALAAGLAALLLASAPWWTALVADPQARRIVRPAKLHASVGAHLRSVLPQIHVPLGGIVGTHVPVIADDPVHVVSSGTAACIGLALVYAGALGLALASAAGDPRRLLLILTVAAVLALFPIPARSSPHTIRYLATLYVPLVALVGWAAATLGAGRRALVLVLLMAALHLLPGRQLLAAWRSLDRSAAPFLLLDLAPVRAVLDQHGVRRVYASYGPAYRLTFATRETIVASPPWNERFRNYPLPYLDDVRVAKNVAWVLTPGIASDLPTPQAFEAALTAAGGNWKRVEAGGATIFLSFEPPFSAAVGPFPGAGAAGDGNLATAMTVAPNASLTFTLAEPRRVDAITLVAAAAGPALPRSLDLEISADGSTFTMLSQRRAREERFDLRWVNGHPQYVTESDLLSVPLPERTLAALRVSATGGASGAIGEVLLHPPGAAGPLATWPEWLAPGLAWPQLRERLVADPHPDRADWYFRMLLVSRH